MRVLGLMATTSSLVKYCFILPPLLCNSRYNSLGYTISVLSFTILAKSHLVANMYCML
jgi:hypothetical protein